MTPHTRWQELRPFSAIVLAGGTSARFGADKLAVRVAGSTLLDRVLAATDGAQQVVVVGAPRPVGRPVTWALERPAGSGPASAIAAALPLVDTAYVVVLAGDLPFVDARTVARLLAAATPAAALTDAHGRTQYLCSAFRTATLQEAVGTADWAHRRVRELLAPMRLCAVAAEGAEAHDVDRPEDVPSEP